MRHFSVRKSELLSWGRTRARALRARRGVRAGRRVRCERSGTVALEPFEVLDPGPGDVLVRVDLSAVSPGTERAQYNRLPGVTIEPPFTPGYSGVGRVLRVGPGAGGFRPGDRIAGPFHHQSLETVAASRCHPVPDRLPDEAAAFVGLGIIALHGVRRAGIAWGEEVLVLGRGLLGQLTGMLAEIAGSGAVTLAGRSDAVAPASADVVFDLTGNPEAIQRAVAAARPAGRVVLAGSPRGATPAWPAGAAAPVEIRGVHATQAGAVVAGRKTWTPREEGDLFLEWLACGRLTLTGPGVETIKPDECWEFYRRLGRGAPRVERALFDWRTLPDGERDRASTLRFPEVVVPLDADQEARRRRSVRLKHSSGWGGR